MTPRVLAIGVGMLCVSANAVAAQSYARLDLGGFLQVGGEAERYARVLQIAGLTGLTPWSIQPFSPSQNELLQPSGPHPWASRFGRDSGRVRLLRPSGRLIENSGFPYQIGIGPTWAGRGLTAEGQAGVMAYSGPFHLQVAPLAFIAQNSSFALAPNGQTGALRFSDPRFPGGIDAPQRFGDATYSRVVPGTSMASVDAAKLFVGFSTAPNQWGPEREYQLLLGPNAGGFPSLFAGTATPVDLWLFKVHGRLVYGRLDQSRFAYPDSVTVRLGEGFVGVIEPRGMRGLELGGGRFLHRSWNDLSFRAFARPFSQIVGANLTGQNSETENQMASLFARWALPGARSEFYGEFYKEDYPGAFHKGPGSIVEAPDDLSSFAFGFQHALTVGASRITVLRGEITNSEIAHYQRLERGFNYPYPPYIHGQESQGHTVNGLILGSPEAYGGAAWRLGVDQYLPAGRRSISLERAMRLDWLAGMPNSEGVRPDVLYAVRLEWLRFLSGRDIGVTLVPAIDLNRNLIAGHDQFNLTIGLTGRGWP